MYIRVTHRRAVGYIKTDKVVTKNELTKNWDIKDPFVLQYCTKRILEYNELLNKKEIFAVPFRADTACRVPRFTFSPSTFPLSPFTFHIKKTGYLDKKREPQLLEILVFIKVAMTYSPTMLRVSE